MDVQIMAAFACAAFFLAGLLFLHLGIRSKLSLVSLVSFGLFVAWIAIAHWTVHLYLDKTGTPSLHRMGQYSAHPTFDTTNNVVLCVLMVIFCLSFLLTGISVFRKRANQRGRA